MTQQLWRKGIKREGSFVTSLLGHKDVHSNVHAHACLHTRVRTHSTVHAHTRAHSTMICTNYALIGDIYQINNYTLCVHPHSFHSANFLWYFGYLLIVAQCVCVCVCVCVRAHACVRVHV